MPGLDLAVGPAGPQPAAPRRPRDVPGHRAMWVGICLEFVEFAVFFAVYFSARWFHPAEFRDGAHRLWTLGGVAITAAMVTSGWMLTRLLAAMREDRRRAALAWLSMALLVGACYPVIKVFEWQWNLAQGLHAGAGIFVVVYWYLTINHFVHASWGLLGMACAWGGWPPAPTARRTIAAWCRWPPTGTPPTWCG